MRLSPGESVAAICRSARPASSGLRHDADALEDEKQCEYGHGDDDPVRCVLLLSFFHDYELDSLRVGDRHLVAFLDGFRILGLLGAKTVELLKSSTSPGTVGVTLGVHLR